MSMTRLLALATLALAISLAWAWDRFLRQLLDLAVSPVIGRDHAVLGWCVLAVSAGVVVVFVVARRGMRAVEDDGDVFRIDEQR